jgi:hypothetical protein
MESILSQAVGSNRTRKAGSWRGEVVGAVRAKEVRHERHTVRAIKLASPRILANPGVVLSSVGRSWLVGFHSRVMPARLLRDDADRPKRTSLAAGTQPTKGVDKAYSARIDLESSRGF